MFKSFGTAGDVGLTAEAAGPGELLAELARGVSALSTSARSLRPETSRKVSLSSDSPQSLVVNFLNELIYLADTEGFLPAAAEIEASFAPGNCRLEAELKGEKEAFKRHPRGLLLKAATYHGLAVEEKGGRWTARVLLDI